ncbi:hypothetical protein D9613_004703 [Agrocybe pediades]|uniref:Haloacid dehalogenase n=1 Tax=Agrocybe pediades TaxID=84607 RepID=A0A8H4QYM8_9AGAR|nr:hypothetical protein D9613_004703 [Agrocybe pediades]
MDEIEALVFDVFGTVVDWRSSAVAELQALLSKNDDKLADTDWVKFVEEWHLGYDMHTERIAAGGAGPLNVDVLHREILEGMLNSSAWAHVGRAWDDNMREEVNLVWHRLKGWPDAVEGLHAVKKLKIIATLSNGNVKLLVDMARHANLPWDMIFSTELFGTYKPSPKTYLSACHHLSLPPHKCAFVAAHIDDLRAASAQGMRTVYVYRPHEDDEALAKIDGGIVKTKDEGGEADVVVRSFVELAEVLKRVK